MKKNKFITYTTLFIALTFTCLSCKDTTSIEQKELLLSTNELTLKVGENTTLTITSAPTDVDDVLVWSSDNETVATIFNGTITTLNSGTSIITATLGNYETSCILTVPERNYELVWSDEFDGTELDSENWSYEIGTGSWGWGNGEEQYYTNRTENIRVENGYLNIEARMENYEGSGYTSARIITKDKRNFKYGKIEARIKVPSGTGTWPGYWMLGNGSWPIAGEIDIMEYVGYDPNVFHCALHSLNKNGSNGQNQHGSYQLDKSASEEFHTIRMEWVENEFMGFDRIHIYIDDIKSKTFAETTQLRNSGDWPFNDDFYFILNMAIGGSWGGIQGIDDSIFDTPVIFQVDYIRVYQLQYTDID